MPDLLGCLMPACHEASAVTSIAAWMTTPRCDSKRRAGCGAGTTQELRKRAGDQGQEIFKLLWQYNSGLTVSRKWRKKMATLSAYANNVNQLEGAFTAGSTRLA